MGKKIPIWQCGLVLVIMLALLFWEVILTGDGEGHLALILAAAVGAVVAILNGWKWEYIERGIVSSIGRTIQPILILMVVGIMIALWTLGGVVPAMIYYGLQITSPKSFLLCACILCCITSLATGSSWTTAGTMGVALIGIGTGLGIEPPMTAGAIISGAYFGDKMSPLSDTTNLAPAMAGCTLWEHIRHMVWTVTPSLLVALMAYTVIGFRGHGRGDLSIVGEMSNALKEVFIINPLFLIPPLVVILMVVFKAPALPGLLGGCLLGVVGMTIQGVEAKSWMKIANYGMNFSQVGGKYQSSSESINELLTCQGMQGMMWTISLILCAMTFGGVLEATGMLESMAQNILKVAKGRGGLVTATILSCIFINVVACDQYLSIILPGKMYREAFEDMRLKGKNLSRCLEDSGTITSNLIPWTTCGVTMKTFLGVGQWGPGGYGKYAVLNYVNPLISLFYGWTGITMEKMTDEEYREILRNRKKEREEELRGLEE